MSAAWPESEIGRETQVFSDPTAGGEYADGSMVAIENIGFCFHGRDMTHLDSLAHMAWEGKTYNGHQIEEKVGVEAGATVLDVVEASNVIGHVAGKRCILLDDMIDTAGTIVAAADLLKQQGATEVWAMATHGVLSDPATERLKNSVIEKVVITNTLPLPSEKRIDKIEVLSIAPLIADALNAVFDDTSVSEIFGGENQA